MIEPNNFTLAPRPSDPGFPIHGSYNLEDSGLRDEAEICGPATEGKLGSRVTSSFQALGFPKRSAHAARCANPAVLKTIENLGVFNLKYWSRLCRQRQQMHYLPHLDLKRISVAKDKPRHHPAQNCKPTTLATKRPILAITEAVPIFPLRKGPFSLGVPN